MAGQLEAIEIKRKTFFEFENAPYVCIDFEVSRPTARGGQTLVRLKMRNLVTRAVFDKTFKAGEKFAEPDLVQVSATFLYSDGDGFHLMDQESFETLTLSSDTVGDDSELRVDNLLVQILKYNGNLKGQEKHELEGMEAIASVMVTLETKAKGLGHVDPAGWDRTAKDLTKAGFYSAPPNVKAAYTTEFPSGVTP